MEFLKEKHLKYLDMVKKSRDFFSYGGVIREHLGLPGAYWSLTSCYLLKKQITDSTKEELLKWIESCQNNDGGFGGNTNHDSNITCTLYALIIYMLFEKLEKVDKKKIKEYVFSLYNSEIGAFKGDLYGEIDGRFVYSAIYCLKIIKEEIPKKCISFFEKCFNYDGGFGGTPGAESHAAYTFCAVGGISIMNALKFFDEEKIMKFLAIRQTSTGGFNGRPEKLPDVCYSWWVLSSIKAIPRNYEIVDLKALEGYILKCQDNEDGGFTDRPGNGNDVFHTFFALAALAIIDSEKYGLEKVDPVYAIPVSVKDKYIDKD